MPSLKQATRTSTGLPGYVALSRSGELDRRAAALWRVLERCAVCPYHCAVNRLRDERGRCKIGDKPAVAAHVAHFGEEPCLSGTRGSGNVFLNGCNMRCVYCQNHQISQSPARITRDEVSLERLAEMYLELQAQGCHVLGLVSPSHVVPHVIGALAIAAKQGLRLPLMYNTNGYDELATLRLLDGVVDVYLPDLKYADNAAGQEWSGTRSYWDAATQAVLEMWRQVGPLQLDENGIARRGMIIRHLVLPNDLADSEQVLGWIAEHIGVEVTLSLMAQYYPTHKADKHVLLSRRTSFREYDRVIDMALDLGFEKVFVQEHEDAADNYRPDFKASHPFHHDEPSTSSDAAVS